MQRFTAVPTSATWALPQTSRDGSASILQAGATVRVFAAADLVAERLGKKYQIITVSYGEQEQQKVGTSRPPHLSPQICALHLAGREAPPATQGHSTAQMYPITASLKLNGALVQLGQKCLSHIPAHPSLAPQVRSGRFGRDMSMVFTGDGTEYSPALPPDGAAGFACSDQFLGPWARGQ